MTIEPRVRVHRVPVGSQAKGKSVCARVRASALFFFELGDDDTPSAVARELEDEIDTGTRDCTLACTERTFCHFYGYEPDASTASRRREHRYLEVSYPSLATWRDAVRLRKRQEYVDLRERVSSLRDEDARVRAEIEDLRVRAARDDSLAAEYRARVEAHVPREKLLDLLSKRLAAQAEAWEDFEYEHGRDDDDVAPARARVRPAQEWFVDPTTRLLQTLGLAPSRWVAVSSVTPVDECVSVCDVEIECKPEQLSCLADRDETAPLTHCYYDIETTGLDAQTASVIQISLVFRRGEERKQFLVGMRDYADVPDTTVVSVEEEADVLRQTQRLVLEQDPDSLVSYNGVNFDNPFLEARATILGVDQFRLLSRFALRPARLRELRLQSSGMGTTSYDTSTPWGGPTTSGS